MELRWFLYSSSITAKHIFTIKLLYSSDGMFRVFSLILLSNKDLKLFLKISILKTLSLIKSSRFMSIRKSFFNNSLNGLLLSASLKSILVRLNVVSPITFFSSQQANGRRVYARGRAYKVLIG